MKGADIKVGEEYAYKNYDRAEPQRVKVLETRVPQTSGYLYSRRTMRTGVRVQILDGHAKGRQRVVRSQTIYQPWSEWAPIKQARDEDRARAAEQSKIGFEKRWDDIAFLDGVFKDLGVGGKDHMVNEAEEQAATRRGLPFIKSEIGYHPGYVTLHGIDEDGRVDRAAAVTLAQALDTVAPAS